MRNAVRQGERRIIDQWQAGSTLHSTTWCLRSVAKADGERMEKARAICAMLLTAASHPNPPGFEKEEGNPLSHSHSHSHSRPPSSQSKRNLESRWGKRARARACNVTTSRYNGGSMMRGAVRVPLFLR